MLGLEEAARAGTAAARPAAAVETGSPAAAGSALSLVGVSRVHGAGRARVVAIEDLSLEIRVGEFVCVVGASGCGKSSLLALIVGLDEPSSGRIEVRGGRATLIFQEAALFPWLTAAQNIDLALKLRGMRRERRAETVGALLDMVHLAGAGTKRPHELSGGMQQRVQIARALAQQAEILLMDEPFGALDAITRDLLHDELERLWQATGLTVVFVTHNVREAVRLGDRVVLLSARPGRVVAEFAVDIARPRRIESPEVASLAAVITDRLRAEVLDRGRA